MTTETETANSNVPSEKPLKEYNLEVPVPLSGAEKQSYHDQLVELLGQKRLLENKKKQMTKQVGTEISKVQNDVDRIQSALKAGEEIRMADVYDIWNNGVIETRRRSDKFVVRTRAATIEDRQESIPGIDDDEPLDGDDVDDDEPDPVVATPPGGAPPQDGFDEHDGETVRSSTGGAVHHMPDDATPDGDDEGDDFFDDDAPAQPKVERDDAPAEAAEKKGGDKAARKKAIADTKKKTPKKKK
jgi:hypothetical protein